MPDVYGLIGEKLTHSFSKKYFSNKFENEGITDCVYELFEMSEVAGVRDLHVSYPGLKGLNVTIPYKTAIIPLLDELDPSAKKVGAVNVVKINKGHWTGFNSDYFGFYRSLVEWIDKRELMKLKCLVLGSGGASKAVTSVLDDLSVPYQLVSRSQRDEVLMYSELNDRIMSEFKLLINTTPLGTYPDIESKPDLPYQLIDENHYLYDLVYNPEETSFMKEGVIRGANVKNGLDMLHMQAEKSWEIWNS